MASAFTPPPLDSHQGPAPFTPPPLSSHQGPAGDTAVRDQLKNEGFLDSAWNAIKSPFTFMGSFFNGEYKKQHEADYARMEELQKNGTPEQRREFGKEMLLKHLPGASTIYKAAQGNIPGALGDVAGMAALGGAMKAGEVAPEYAPAVKAGVKAAMPDVMAGGAKAAAGAAIAETLPGGPIKYALGGAPAYAGARQISKGLGKGVEAFKQARTAAPPGAPPPPASPGQILAESQGMDWAKLKPDDQALLETAARAQANAAAQPSPAQRPAAQPQQAPAAAPQPAPAQPGMTAADLIQQEFAAKQANAPPPPQPLQGGHPAARIVPKGNAPVRPPLRQPEPPNVPSAPEAAAVQPPPARTTAAVDTPGTFTRVLEEPPILAKTFIDPLAKSGAIDDSGARTMEMAVRRMVLSQREAGEIIKRAKGDGPITGKQIAEAIQSLAKEDPNFGEKGMEFGSNRIGWDTDQFTKQVDQARAARTLPQVEAAMAQKAPSPLEPPTSRYTSTGEKKSPQLRGAEMNADNVAKKAQRFAEAFHSEGVTAEDLGNMTSGDLDVFTEGMKAKNRIDPKTGIAQNETVPKTSFPLIKKRLKAMEVQEALRDAMIKSGTAK